MNKETTQNTFSRFKMDGNITRLLILLFALVLVASITKTNSFLTLTNFLSMERQLVEYGLMSLGVGIALMSGGIDLSVVYIANLSAVVSGLFMRTFIPVGGSSNELLFIIIGIGLGLLTGVLCGLFNGFLVSRVKIPAMLATLGTMQLYMGLAIILSEGSTVGGIPKTFTQIGRLNFLGVLPVSFLIYLVAVIIVAFIMGKTKFGQRLYLIGTNSKAARFAGINNNRVLTRAYVLSGILASSAGLLSLARLSTAKADFGSSFMMLTILIAVLGGVNPDGGSGKIAGIFLATLIVQVSSSYLNMFPGVSNFYRDLIWGVGLIVVLIINHTVDKRETARLARITK